MDKGKIMPDTKTDKKEREREIDRDRERAREIKYTEKI